MTSPRTPLATYRVQWQEDFGFAEAASIAPYLDALGISDLYVPPVTAGQSGALHGYAVVDPSRVSAALGDEASFVALGRALASRRMGLLVDFVPNHMGVAGGQNHYFVDVLENGRCSLYADLFDIEWDPPKEGLKEKLLLPVLGEQYGDALASGKLRVVLEAGALALAYYDHRLPLEPSSTVPLLEEAASALDDEEARAELRSIAASFRHLPHNNCHESGAREERAREKEIGKRRIRELLERSPAAQSALEGVVRAYAPAPGDAEAMAKLDALLREQSYRPCFWRVAMEATNYRRFFDVNDLAAIRVEEPWVFTLVHELLLRMVKDDVVQGVRIDHVDGLYNPRLYLETLRRALAEASSDRKHTPYVVIEKILERGERLPRSFACEGTTGYDFARLATGALVDGRARSAFAAAYRQVTHDARSYDDVARTSKAFVLEYILASEVAMLTRALERIAEAEPRSRDFSRKALEEAIVGTIAAFPVYRTYVEPSGERGENDAAHIERAIAAAARNLPGVDRSVFVFLRDVLLGRGGAGDNDARIAFAMKFQQTSGPVMAKAIEDTAFYAHPMFLAANEVGADPAHPSVSLEELHAELTLRARDWPHTMNATSTHDTKRSEDVRARLAVLSEMPDEWKRAVARWRRIARRHRTRTSEGIAPSPQDELAFFQTLVGAAPFGATEESVRGLRDRLRDNAIKFAKEAKVSTSWIQPNEAYEAALAAFVEGMLGDESFVSDVTAFCREIDPFGVSNALAQVVLKVTAPGVPDFYQGSEVWHQRLVDPDNRAPVDFAALQRRLHALREDGRSRAERARHAIGSFATGDIKLLVTAESLAVRRRTAATMCDGDYVPLDGDPHAIAFARTREGSPSVITIATRLPRTLLHATGSASAHAFAVGDVWRGRKLKVPRPLDGEWENVLTGERIAFKESLPLHAALSDLPVAVLCKVGS